MIYLYFNEKTLYLFKNGRDMGDNDSFASCECYWEEIDSVTADKERGQICAHVLGKGIVAEFPIGRTILTCLKPTNK